jgi:BioD-like phosphotransacetylase family protein
VYITDVDGNVASHTPLLLGLVNYFERHLPYVGYFIPIAGTAHPETGDHALDKQLRLVHDAFELKYDMKAMMGVPEEEAVKLLTSGKKAELLDRIFASYTSYKEMHDVVLVHGLGLGTGRLDADVASAINAPAIITCRASNQTAADIVRKVQLKKALLDDLKVNPIQVSNPDPKLANHCQHQAFVQKMYK